jgi:hypothetical protein
VNPVPVDQGHGIESCKNGISSVISDGSKNGRAGYDPNDTEQRIEAVYKAQSGGVVFLVYKSGPGFTNDFLLPDATGSHLTSFKRTRVDGPLTGTVVNVTIPGFAWIFRGGRGGL